MNTSEYAGGASAKPTGVSTRWTELHDTHAKARSALPNHPVDAKRARMSTAAS